MKIRPWPLIIITNLIGAMAVAVLQYLKPSTNDLENWPVVFVLPVILGISAAVYTLVAAISKSPKVREFTAVLLFGLAVVVYLVGIFNIFNR